MRALVERFLAPLAAAWLCAVPALTAARDAPRDGASQLDARGGAAARDVGQRSENEKLVGNWRLLSFTWKDLDTGDTHNAYGRAPKGFINYGRDGRALALIVQEGRPKPADVSKVTAEEALRLVKSVIGWGGTYDFDGKTVTHHVDMSANETWTGTDQIRTVVLEGNRLMLTTPPMVGPDGSRGIAVTIFERTEPTSSQQRG